MGDPAWTLLAVVIGGSFATGGTLLADVLKDRRNRRDAKRERLREDLYVLIDDIKDLIDAQGDAQLLRAMRIKVVFQTMKIDDRLLVSGTEKLINKIDTQSDEPLGAASEAIGSISLRIAALLHEDDATESLLHESDDHSSAKALRSRLRRLFLG